MVTPDCITIDFETYPIAQRPDYPPKPVGVSIKWPGQQSNYYAFGHPTGNNTDEHNAKRKVQEAIDSAHCLLFHHAKFDTAVILEAWGFPAIPWDRIHDTMFLAYLMDPHSRAIGLKQLAASWLNWPAAEKDKLADWIIYHGPQLLERYAWNKSSPGQKKITKSQIGAWIFAAPGELVGEYACGDTDRTDALFQDLWPSVQELGMGAAYDTERELMPILSENEQQGMRVDVPGLERDMSKFGADFDMVEQWLRQKLRASGLNFDADADVASVLFDRGIVPQGNWTMTAPTKAHPGGQLSMSKDNLLPEHFTGEDGDMIAAALGYRNRLKTCLTMFMGPWLDQARRNGGYISTNWNQTRGTDQGGGTRTGRPSTDRHNLLNVSKSWMGRDDQYRHPDFLPVQELPLCRNYVLPDEGELWLHRDFSGQELRIFAHFEQGDLWRQYEANPRVDPHEFVGAELMAVAGREIERTRVKTLNFQGLYGGGIPALQRKLRVPYAEAKMLKAFHNEALPGRQILNEVIKTVINYGRPIRTVGGRLYMAEPPGDDGRSKLYKLINYLIQGSAADCTKRSIIDWYNHPGRKARFLITVYDENNISAAKHLAAKQMAVLRECMEQQRLGLTVPMLSDGKWGESWGKLQKGEPT